MVGIVVGSRLGYVLFYDPEQHLADPVRTLVIWRGGMSFHESLAGVAVADWLSARRRDFPVLAFSDLMPASTRAGCSSGASQISSAINDLSERRSIPRTIRAKSMRLCSRGSSSSLCWSSWCAIPALSYGGPAIGLLLTSYGLIHFAVGLAQGL
jgi:hypothetical protein